MLGSIFRDNIIMETSDKTKLLHKIPGLYSSENEDQKKQRD